MSHLGIKGWRGVEEKIEELQGDIDLLLQVADIYVAAFTDDDRLSLTEAFMLTKVREVIAKYEPHFFRQQRCEICGTEWTADEKLPCPTPELHDSSKFRYDVTDPQEFKIEYPPDTYQTSLDGVFWSTGFCQTCQKVRYNVDNERGLCGWCAEEYYPLDPEETKP